MYSRATSLSDTNICTYYTRFKIKGLLIILFSVRKNILVQFLTSSFSLSLSLCVVNKHLSNSQRPIL